MRKLIILMLLMLLLPIGIDSTLRADNILPPNPGLDDGDPDDGDEDGDHPWGEENSMDISDKYRDRNDQRATLSATEIIYYSFNSYFGIYFGDNLFSSYDKYSGSSYRTFSKSSRFYSSRRLSSRRDR